jgi:hypothetical protein
MEHRYSARRLDNTVRQNRYCAKQHDSAMPYYAWVRHGTITRQKILHAIEDIICYP